MIDQGSGPNSTTAVAATSHDPTDKTLAELLSDLSQELASLMHQELDLAKAEVTAKGKRMGVGAGLVAGAGVVAFLGLAAVVACVIAALSEALAVWLAALLVGVVLLAIAGVLGVLGKTDIQRASPPVPKEAVESTKEDVAWLKTQVKSAKP
jgi:nucleoside permease NupC